MDNIIYNTIVSISEVLTNLKTYISTTALPHYFDIGIVFLLSHSTKIYTYLAILIIVLLFARQLQKIIVNGMINRKIASFSKPRPRILNEGQKNHILILGDSTAYGTGAAMVQETLAGRFAHDFPNIETHNYAINGSLTRDVFKQLENVQDSNYKLVIISTGGNDTWHFTNIESVARDIRSIIEKAKLISHGHVILIIYNNIASGPVFPFFIRSTLLRRTDRINKLFIAIAAELGVEAVPIFLEGEKCPSDFFARDGLHPSSEGYRIMYVRLWSVLLRRMQDFNLREL